MELTAIVISIISLIVALITLSLKLYSDHYKVDVYFSTYHNEHSICIANRTTKPLLIYGYELYWKEQAGDNPIDCNAPDSKPTKIEPYGYVCLAFNEQKYFSLTRVGKLYIKLTITGKKTRKKLLHSNVK